MARSSSNDRKKKSKSAKSSKYIRKHSSKDDRRSERKGKRRAYSSSSSSSNYRSNKKISYYKSEKYDKKKDRHRNKSHSSSESLGEKISKKSALKYPENSANLRHGIKQALQNAEKQDTSLKSIKEMKNSLLFTRDIKLASNPDNPIEKTSLLESINSSNFSQIPFISSSKKKTETNSSSNPNEANVNKHDNAMFGSKPIPDTQKLDLASIQLPNERPLYSLSISSITDPKMLIHKQYHVTKEEKFKSWITYIENISKEINV